MRGPTTCHCYSSLASWGVNSVLVLDSDTVDGAMRMWYAIWLAVAAYTYVFVKHVGARYPEAVRRLTGSTLGMSFAAFSIGFVISSLSMAFAMLPTAELAARLNSSRTHRIWARTVLLGRYVVIGTLAGWLELRLPTILQEVHESSTGPVQGRRGSSR